MPPLACIDATSRTSPRPLSPAILADGRRHSCRHRLRANGGVPHSLVTALTASGSSRLFPDPLGCFRISPAGSRGRRWGRDCRASADDFRVDGWPRPQAPPLVAFLPGERCSRMLVFQTPKFFSSKASWCLNVTLDALSKLYLLRVARQPHPKEGEALSASPEPRSRPFAPALAALPLEPGSHCNELWPGLPAPPPSWSAPRGRAGSAPLFRALESPSSQSYKSGTYTSPLPL